jgi:hypothetical protein
MDHGGQSHDPVGHLILDSVNKWREPLAAAELLKEPVDGEHGFWSFFRVLP